MRARRATAAILAVVLLLIAIAWYLAPSGEDVQARAHAEAARHGVTLLETGEVPPELAQALISIEDERFYQHHGIDALGIARSVLFDVSHACACEGGSTITQQLVKRLYLGGNDAGLNKLQGMILAFKVETVIDKQRILADYLSIVYFGHGAYGAPSAACMYFHRHLDALSLTQYALLAGLPQAPSYYDPLIRPAAAKGRRDAVLEAMRSDDYISLRQMQAAQASPVFGDVPAHHAC